MASTNNCARRIIAVGVFAVAAAAAPAIIATVAALTPDTGTSTSAQPACLAWYGNKDDGICLSYSNGNGVTAGTPGIAWGGADNPGPGLSTGPLLPGTTISRSIG